jgi:6-methylsalicylate decarboxylase
MICDVHAHCTPRAVGAILEEVGVHRDWPEWMPKSDSDGDIDARLEMMDEAGVQVQVLSLTPFPELEREADTVRMVQHANDAIAEIAARHPHRFIAYAELPLPYLDASLKELERCRTELGISAVNILTASGTSSSVAPELDPLYEEIGRTETIVFFHPRVNGLCSPLLNDWGLAGPIGPLFEDSVLVCQMVQRQFPQRFSNLKMIIAHLGGILPIYLERMDSQMRSLSEGSERERPSDTARRLWYDTLSHDSVPALRSAHASFGVDRLVTGSDFPAMVRDGSFASCFDYIRHAGLPEADVEQILHVNAPRLFGLAMA